MRQELSTIAATSQLSVQSFGEQLEARVHAAYQATREAQQIVDCYRPPNQADLQSLEAAETFVKSDEYHQLLADCRAAAEPASEREIRTELSCLVAAFPTAARADLKVFGALLVADVAAAKPSKYGLATACRSLRRTSRFLPSISETLEAIEKAERSLHYKRRSIETMPEHLAKIRRIATEYENIEQARSKA